MKKKIFLFVLLAALGLALLLTACTPKDTHQGKVTIEIATAEDFRSIARKLGKDYDEATFVLKNDIDLTTDEAASWTPIGDSAENSFRSVFDGNGHTVRYRIRSEEIEALKNGMARPEHASYGLFGYLYGATVKNLEIVATLELNANANATYAGVLAGYAAQNVKLENVRVNAEHIAVRTVGRYESQYAGWDADDQVIYPADDQTLYLGGVIGYAIGGLQGESLKVDLNARLSTSGGLDSDTFYVNEFFFGGVVGFSRPVQDKNEETNDISTLTHVTTQGSVEASAMRATIGGVAGYIQKGSVKNVSSTITQNISTRFRMSSGAIAGKSVSVTHELIKAGTEEQPLRLFYQKIGVNDDKNLARSAGGLIGYLDGGSLTKSYVAITMQTRGNLNYAGGVAGVVRDAALSDIAAFGTMQKVDNVGNRPLNWDTSDCFAGVAGRVRGRASLSDIDVNVESFYGAIGSALPSVSVDPGEDDEVQKEEVNDNVIPKIADTVTYLSQNSGITSDMEVNHQIANVYGSALASADQYEARRDALLTLME